MSPSRNSLSGHLPLVMVMSAAAVGLFLGWKLFWFLTDDAYIAFRYISNSLAGHGYVWNAPPFRPVEGYTSFLWVFLLDIIWRIFRVSPPVAANWLSLGFTYLNLVIMARILFKMSWPDHLKRARVLFLLLGFVFLLTNRSFLAWSSSGLETALFCLLVTAWVYSCLYAKHERQLVLISLSASLLTLTRPDGLLYVAFSLVLFVVLYGAGRGYSRRHVLLSALPFTLVGLHLLWRRYTYGEWLPNTYYAKSVSLWPASGFRYASSFILEFGLWFWLAVMVVAAVWLVRRSGQKADNMPVSASTGSWIRILADRRLVLALVVATLVAHLGYYTVAVGGDHFEYRVYNHLFPLLFISFVGALFSLGWSLRLSVAAVVVMILVSLPVPWTHWGLTHNINTRDNAYVMVVPIADRWPGVFRWYAQLFDDTQSWLIPHHVCMRHQEHKVFHEFQVSEYPVREAGAQISGEGYPVHLCRSVGVPGWMMPNVNILDKLGLNDYVIARIPVTKSQFRMMAHDRLPPPGYIPGFSPNVKLKNGNVVVVKRNKPLTMEKIINHESFWWQTAKEGIPALDEKPIDLR